MHRSHHHRHVLRQSSLGHKFTEVDCSPLARKLRSVQHCCVERLLRCAMAPSSIASPCPCSPFFTPTKRLAISKAYSWGRGRYGRLGHGDYKDRWEPCRVEGLGVEPVALIAAGKAHSMAVSLPQAVFVWGRGCVCNALCHTGTVQLTI